MEDIEHRPLLTAGSAHIKAIRETGGEILGIAPVPLGTSDFTSLDELKLGTWGFKFIERVATARLDPQTST